MCRSSHLFETNMTLSEEYMLEENMMDSWEVVHMELLYGKEKGTDGPFVAVKIILPQKEGKTDCLTTISQLREIKIIKETQE